MSLLQSKYGSTDGSSTLFTTSNRNNSQHNIININHEEENWSDCSLNYDYQRLCFDEMDDEECIRSGKEYRAQISNSWRCFFCRFSM